MAYICSLEMCFCILWILLQCTYGKLIVSFPVMSCEPPRGDVCVEIRQCPYFDDLLNRTTIPRPRNVVKIIRERQCGFHGNTPFVCCSKQDSPPSAITNSHNENPAADPSSTLLSLKTHPHYKLLPTDRCGPISTNFRITNGKKAMVSEFPWMALIAYSSDVGIDFRCGGTIINEWYVLTAAHCIINTTIAGVRLGEHNLDTQLDCDTQGNYCAPSIQDVLIKKISVHPNYNSKTFDNDIALIRLASPANFTYPSIQPVCLPFENMDLSGKFAVVTGWGVTEDGYKSSELLKVSVPVLPNIKCQSIYQSFAPITNRQICAGGYQGRDSCGGDSGGPLNYVGLVGNSPRYMQFGIVSYGPRNCGTDGKPGIYTKVSEYLKWLLDNIEPGL